MQKIIDTLTLQKREIQALLHASTELECRELLILAENYEAEEDVKWFGLEGNIQFLPLWKWVLAGQ